MVLRVAFPAWSQSYISTAAEAEPFGLIFLEFRTEIIGPDGCDELIILESNILMSKSEGGGPAGAGAGDFVIAVASICMWVYRIFCCILKRSVLGKENFCLEVELLRRWAEMSSSAMAGIYVNNSEIK